MRTRSLRAAARSGALLAGAGAATALGWSSWVETDVSTGATVARATAPAAGALTRTPRSPARPVTIQVCQATPDGGYVLVDVRPERLEEYRRDPNTLVPAPAGGCPARVGAGTEPPPAAPAPAVTPAPAAAKPKPAVATPKPAPPKPKAAAPAPKPAAAKPVQASTTTPAPASASAEPAATTSAAPATLAQATPAPATSAATPGVAGVRVGSTTAPAIVPTTGRLPAHLERLPATGDETALLLFLGADLLLLGAGLRLRTRGVTG